MSKLKTVVTFLLVVSVLSAGAAYIINSVWAGEQPQAKAVVATQAEPKHGEKLKALLEARRDFAKTQFAVWKQGAFQWKELADRSIQSILPGGTGESNKALELQMNDIQASKAQDQLYQWAQRLLTAELELSEKKPDRVAAYSAHLLRVKDLEDHYKKGVKKGEADAYLATAEFHRLDAEVMLERAKAK